MYPFMLEIWTLFHSLFLTLCEWVLLLRTFYNLVLLMNKSLYPVFPPFIFINLLIGVSIFGCLRRTSKALIHHLTLSCSLSIISFYRRWIRDVSISQAWIRSGVELLHSGRRLLKGISISKFIVKIPAGFYVSSWIWDVGRLSSFNFMLHWRSSNGLIL